MTPPRPGALALSMLLWLPCLALGGCRACEKEEPRTRKPEHPQPIELAEPEVPVESMNCKSPQDCGDDNPCTEERCVAGHCVTSPAAEGKHCDNDTICDGVASCNQTGQCVPGVIPSVDDGNACTEDSCDPVRGILHQSIPVDDSNECTMDACDPETGAVTHRPVDPADGDDCTVDSCDPQSGVRHQPRSPAYTCETNCAPGFHVTSRIADRDCLTPPFRRSVCMPDCGLSFYTCDPSCPAGYRAGAKAPNSQCGSSLATYTFCQKDPQYHAPVAGATGR